MSRSIKNCCMAAVAAGFLSAALVPVACAAEIEQRTYVGEPTQKAFKNDPGWKEYVICEDRFCNPAKGLKLQQVKPRDVLISVRLSQDLPAAPVPSSYSPSSAIHAQDKGASLLHTVPFSFNSAVMSRKEKAGLISATDNVQRRVAVEGFSCDLGTKRYNDALALKRAERVAGLLKGKGITVGKVAGTGKCCYVSREKKLNRRVEVRAVNTEKAINKKGGR